MSLISSSTKSSGFRVFDMHFVSHIHLERSWMEIHIEISAKTTQKSNSVAVAGSNTVQQFHIL